MEEGPRIPEKLFFRIGEVCELIKVQPHVLRYWETEFSMLAPQKNKAGQRVYRRKDVEMVFRIRDLLYEEKFTIAGAKKKLLEETRGGASRTKTVAQEPELDEEDTNDEFESNEPELGVLLQAESEEVEETGLLPGIQVSSAAPQSAPVSQSEPPRQASPPTQTDPPRETSTDSLTQHQKRVLRLLKTDLEDLLTRLNSDVTFKP